MDDAIVSYSVAAMTLYLTAVTAYLVPEEPLILNLESIAFITSIESLGIIASLYFMWGIRHPKTE